MDIRNFKDNAKVAAQYLAEQGIEVPHTRVLEALSRAFGERNWSTLSAQLQQLREPSVASAAGQPVAAWDLLQGPMSEAQYVACGGNRCPFCGSKSLEASEIEADGPQVWDHTRCEDCGASWSSTYSLSGYVDAESGTVSIPQAAGEQGSALPGIREDVVEELVEDVRERARKYGFSVANDEQAQQLVANSAVLLNMDATAAEIYEAASRLA